MISKGTRFVTAEVDGDLFLLDEATSATYKLGGSAGRWWTLLSDGKSVSAAAEIIAAETGETPDRVTPDGERFAAELAEAGLLPDASPPAPKVE